MYRKVIEPLKGIGIHLSFVEQEKWQNEVNERICSAVLQKYGICQY